MLLSNPAKILRLLLSVSLGLILAFVLTRTFHSQLSLVKLGHLRSIFNADGEQSLQTWFSVSLLLVNAAALGLIARVKLLQRAPYRWYWAGLALIFLGLSVDEQAGLHEYLSGLRDHLGVGGLLYFAWVIPAFAALLLFGVIFLRFWLTLPLTHRVLWALAGLLYVGGAVGVEMLAAVIYDQSRDTTMGYLLLTSLEELCEMWGASIFLYAILVYIRDDILVQLSEINALDLKRATRVGRELWLGGAAEVVDKG